MPDGAGQAGGRERLRWFLLVPPVGDRRSLQNTQVAKEHKGRLSRWAEPGGGGGQRETCQPGQRQQHLTADDCFSHSLRSRLTGAFLWG